MRYRWMCALWLAAGCAFDASGSADRNPPDASIPSARPDASSGDTDGDPSDGEPDAGPECVDEDDDGFFRAVQPGAMCGPADCDDDDDQVYPGQSGAFTSPKASGDYDYDCDGVERKLADTTRGEDCNAEIFGPCEGTGWLGGVPECGESGTWHRCDWGTWDCEEKERVDAVMPCN